MATVTTDQQPKKYPVVVQIVLVGLLIAAVGVVCGAILGGIWWLFDVIFIDHNGFAFHWDLGGPKPGDHLLLLWVLGMLLPFVLAIGGKRKGES